MTRGDAVKAGCLAGLVYGAVRHPGALLFLVVVLLLVAIVFGYAVYEALAGYIGPGGVFALAVGAFLRWRFFRNGRRRA